MKTRHIFKVRTNMELKQNQIQSILENAVRPDLNRGEFIIVYEVDLPKVTYEGD